MRKGAFNQKAKELGCNKIAYGHHRDDLVETMLLSLLFEGQFYSFSPKTYLERMDITLIRPLLYVKEADVIGFKNKYHLPVVKSPCPANGYTNREYVKELSHRLNCEHPGATERMFSAVIHGDIKGWPKRVGHLQDSEQNNMAE